MSWKIFVVYIFVIFFVYVFIKEVIISPLVDDYKYNQKRKQWDINNPGKKRKLCKDCKYSVSETLWAGRYRWRIPKRVFSYCKLTKRRLKGDRTTLRCCVAEPSPELIAENESAHPIKGSDTYCSAYGDTYHSYRQCPSIKNSQHVYKNAFFIGLRYCPKCWILKDNMIYPKKDTKK